jgi:carbonic anhydrase
MIRKYVGLPLILASLSISGAAFAGGSASHWSYSGEEGPENWGSLDSEYVACSTGKNQTPIDIKGMVEAELPPIVMSYQANGGKGIINNGHTIQVNYAPGSTITVDGQAFELKQFHFHTPSENHIEGKSYPMEAHFVHLDKDSNITVIGLMYEEGAENAELQKAFAHMPHEAGEKDELPDAVSAQAMLPEDMDYYRFTGSLTTPPCSEGVRWLMLKNHATASKEQIESFTHTMHHPNNRPIQSTNARVILQ